MAAVAIALLVVLLPVSSHAADNTTYNLPWEKFSIQGGAFFAGLNDKVTVGSEGAGVAVDLEQALGLDTQNTVFRAWDAVSHRGDAPAPGGPGLPVLQPDGHQDRSGRDIVVDNVTLAAGTKVETTFNYQIIRAAYSYSFFQDNGWTLRPPSDSS